MTLEIITADALDGVHHGFFTRRGGASSGVFEGLNCGAGSTDQAEAVAINRARVAAAMDLPADALAFVHQVHSARAVPISVPTDGPRETADALVTAQPGLALAVLTADCQPVLFADRTAGVVGAAHAGWKGTLDGVLEATIDAMAALGARRARICAAIGPSISQRAYEVGPEFFETFHDTDGDSARFFVNGDGDRMLFDLPGYGLHRLRDAGVAAAEWTRHCTYSDAARFFSYRRSVHRKEADYGRLISVIRLSAAGQRGRRPARPNHWHRHAAKPPHSPAATHRQTPATGASTATKLANSRDWCRATERAKSPGAARKFGLNSVVSAMLVPYWHARLGAIKNGRGCNHHPVRPARRRPMPGTRRNLPMRKERRWISSVVKEAARTKLEMPWARGSRRAAFIVKRAGQPPARIARA